MSESGFLSNFGNNFDFLSFGDGELEDYEEITLTARDMKFIYMRHHFAKFIRAIGQVPLKINNFIFSIRMLSQRVFRKDHVSDDEVWGLNWALVKFMLPRLIRFRNKFNNPNPPCCVPQCGKDEWMQILDKMIFAFRYDFKPTWANTAEYEMKLYKEYFTDEVNEDNLEDKCDERCNEGFTLFREYFCELWY
jgi:hypothetical protein